MTSDVASAPGRWPGVTFERLPWVSRYEQGQASRNQIRLHRGPYDSSIPAAISSLAFNLDAEVASAVDDAASELARFDEQSGAIVAPFTGLLLRTEAAASSQIENLTASARAIAQAELLGTKDGSNAAQIVSNTSAMTAAVNLAGSMSADAILAMHHALMQNHDPQGAGQWRSEPVWIGGSRLGPHDAHFVPPHHSRVVDAIDDLVAFMQRDDIPVLAQAAIAHAQFETIHPFTDGNGRTGRALIHAMLHGKGLTRHITVPISAGLLTEIEGYFRALDSYREGDRDSMVMRLVDATFMGIANGKQLVAELDAIQKAWNGRIRARKGSHSWRIAELLFEHPVVDVPLIATKLGLSASNTYAPLQPLIDAGVVVESGSRLRGRTWRSDEVLRALDSFARRARRRRH